MAAQWSRSSRQKLETCDNRLIAVANRVLQEWDCKVIYGHRSPSEQFKLFKKGRSKLDGFEKKSYHNFFPSQAIDLVPFPVQWPDAAGLAPAEVRRRLERFHVFGGFVLGIAHAMGIPLYWGNDWDGDWNFVEHDFHDLPHFELRVR